GKNLVMINDNGYFFALDPSNNNQVVFAAPPINVSNPSTLGFVDTTGLYLFITAHSAFETMSGVAVISLATGTQSVKINTEDIDPSYVTFSVNGKFAYVTGSHDSSIARINMTNATVGNWTYDARSSAGVQ